MIIFKNSLQFSKEIYGQRVLRCDNCVVTVLDLNHSSDFLIAE